MIGSVSMGLRLLSLVLCIKVFGLCVVYESNANSATSDTLTTVYYEYIPFTEAYNTQDPKNSVSSSNLLLVNTLSSLVELEFMPTARLTVKLNEKTDKAICSLFKLMNSDRAQQYYYSLPVGFVQTHRFYSRQGIGILPPSLLNEDGELTQLADLFDVYTDAKLILWDNISQGDFIDAAVKSIPEKNKVRIQGLTSYGSLAKMINRARADFAIMLPFEIAHFENKFYPLDLLAYRIAGVEPTSSVHMMCNKSKASKEFISIVDATMRELYKKPEFVAANTFKVASQEIPAILQAIDALQEK
jgi:hypothetical protein